MFRERNIGAIDTEWIHPVCLELIKHREPAQTEVNIGMKPDYYNGAEKGEIEVFKDIPEPLDQLLTPNRNSHSYSPHKPN